MDQAFVGGTSFLTTILVGRDGGPAELGLYSLGFVVFITMLSTQESVLTTPLTIYSPKLTGGRGRRYAGATLAQYMSQSALFSAGLIVAALALTVLPFALAPVMWALAVAVPLRLLLEYGRRRLYAEMKVFEAMRLNRAASLIQIVLMVVLMQVNYLTAATAFASMGVASGLAALVWFVPRTATFNLRRRSIFISWAKNWAIGQWILARQGTLLLAFGSLPWMIALVIGQRETGRFAACLMLVNLANPLIMAFNNLLIPQASRALASGGLVEMRRVVSRTSAILLAVAGALCLMLFIAGEHLMQLFYGEAFAGSGGLLFILALNALAIAAGLGPAGGLVVMERARLTFVLQLLGVCVTLVTSLALIFQMGVAGAAYGYMLGSAVTASTTIVAYRWAVRSRCSDTNRAGMSPAAHATCDTIDLDAKGAI